MSLTISEEAKQRLAPFLTEANTFLLVANDGSNPYSSAEGCCMIGDRFIIVPVDQAEAPYTETIANDLYQKLGCIVIDVASLSIEETASMILNALNLEDHSYYSTETSED